MRTTRTGHEASAEIVLTLASGVDLGAMLDIPAGASGLVVFVHGSGSSRFSVRNRQVASFLVRQGCATLLMDLLTPAEERIDVVTRELRFDIPLLAGRVVGAIDWIASDEDLASLPIGLFGASTGAAAALIAASQRPRQVAAVVSRGGRPDLAGDALRRVQAPTLLIVGGADTIVLDLNREAARHVPAETRLITIPGATHLFEEPGTLEQVAAAAADWFMAHLRRPPS